jgi:TolA-binding protein/predicted negative regulator of RcsB-dependent stress response
MASPAGVSDNQAMHARELMGRMSKMGGVGLLLAAMLVCGGRFDAPALGAPTPPDNVAELQAYDYGLRLFNGSHFPQAEASFGDFLARYTNSVHRPDAILYMARARLGQSNFNGAIDLLQKSSAQAGGLRLDYVFWTATARYAAGDLAHAAEEFALVANDTAPPPLRLEASYYEAEAHSRTGDWPGVIRLLQQTNGPFQRAAAADAKSRFAALGWLLLGEALLHEHRQAEGEKLVQNLDHESLSQDLRWRYQYLLCRLQLDGGRAQAALITITNLLALDAEPRHQAASFFLRGDILEKLGRTNDALAAYTNNLADSQSQEVQWQALARTIQLTVALNPLPQAIQALEALIKQHTQVHAQDLALVSLGELYLKASASPEDWATASNTLPVAATNLLLSALTNFTMVISNFTNSPLLAKARLDRGWCYWLPTNRLATNIAAAETDFAEAAAHLPFSKDQAVATFKLADAQFFLKDYAGAAHNYGLVLALYDKLPEVTNAFFDLALYQLAEADIQLGDDQGAGAAVDKILRWYPGNYFGDRGSLLMGEDLCRKYDYAKARQVFLDLRQRSPLSPLMAEVDYAIARTYDYEGDWNMAMAQYKEWETNHAGDARLPEVEFHLALACGKAGLTNLALASFTNFVLRFPSNEFTPLAQNQVADYYYNQKDFVSAEKNYQELSKNPAAGDLGYQAYFGAGKSALAGSDIKGAHDHFVALVNFGTNAPPALVINGYLALGDTLFQEFLSSQTNEGYLNQAIAAVEKCTNGAPTNAIAVEALGRLGDYYWQWAALDPKTNTFATAKQMYETIVNFPPGSVNVAARSQAEVGLGLVAEQQQQPNAALSHYFKVVYSSLDRFDPYWVGRAGEFAARLCEEQQHWLEAVSVYERVLLAVPALRPVLEKKIAAARAAQARFEAAGK